MTTLQRLLKYPHSAVFDKDPDADLALRVRHADGARWEVADDVLTVRAGALVRTYDLAAMNVGQLAAALVSDGFEVPYVGDTARSALALVEGAGDQAESNGDHLTVFNSLLWALLSGYAGVVRAAELSVAQALRQMVVLTAEGEFLDLWGALYGVPRWPAESDAHYAPRIIREVGRVRVNGHGIEDAIKDATGYDVRIEEPWTELFILDESTLSGPHRLYDGEHYGYHLIRPSTREIVDWDAVMAVVNRNRAAGVLVADLRSTHGAHVDAEIAGLIHAVRIRDDRAAVPYIDTALLDYGEISDVAILNHAARHIRTVLHYSGSEADPAWYVIHALHSRTFRTYYVDVEYVSQFWPDVFAWEVFTGPWTDSTLIAAKHTRTS